MSRRRVWWEPRQNWLRGDLFEFGDHSSVSCPQNEIRHQLIWFSSRRSFVRIGWSWPPGVGFWCCPSRRRVSWEPGQDWLRGDLFEFGDHCGASCPQNVTCRHQLIWFYSRRSFVRIKWSCQQMLGFDVAFREDVCHGNRGKIGCAVMFWVCVHFKCVSSWWLRSTFS